MTYQIQLTLSDIFIYLIIDNLLVKQVAIYLGVQLVIKSVHFNIISHYLYYYFMQNILRKNRKCKLCNRSQIGDEYDYIFECHYFNQNRKQSLSNYFIYRHNIIKFSEIMSSKRKSILQNFISAINTGVCPPGSQSFVICFLMCMHIVNSRCYFNLIVISLYHCYPLAL